MVSNPNGVNLHTIDKFVALENDCFKPQRGKFTRSSKAIKEAFQDGFKPQRGKFTQELPKNRFRLFVVSNPNGVNLHLAAEPYQKAFFSVSNPNGVNLHTFSKVVRVRLIFSFKPQRGKFTRKKDARSAKAAAVSNPNGVNLHAKAPARLAILFSFKPQRGKFTLKGE